MFIALGVLVVVVALGIAIYAYWDILVPQPSQPVAQRGRYTRLQDKRVPGFSLPGLVGPGFETRDLLTSKKPILVKFWGPWSPACITEYPLLMELQASKVEMWGIAFRESRTNALDFLERNGNPYSRAAYDAAGRAASDWGVSSAPSTFLVDGDGIVRWYWAGPLTSSVVSGELWPLLDRFTP